MDLLELLQRVEERGAIETTHRVQQNCGQVFRYAVATARVESDPSRELRGALTPWKPEHYPRLTDVREVGHLLRDVEAYEGGFITKFAMKLAPMLFVRPGELRSTIETPSRPNIVAMPSSPCTARTAGPCAPPTR